MTFLSEPFHRVVFLHGLARTPRSMRPLARFLQERNSVFKPVLAGYPWRWGDLEDQARYLRDSVLDESFWKEPEPVSFVTHSLGGLVLQTYLKNFHNEIPRESLGRVVMLGPPLGGSEVADFWDKSVPHLYRAIFGPVAPFLTTAARQGDPAAFDFPFCPVGVIAGKQSSFVYPESAFVFDELNDGRVAVSKARLQGAADYCVLPVCHHALLTARPVHCAVQNFLETGCFSSAF